MSEDFPAAHSADTTWFAIDADGHVAVFESGEAGCIPSEGVGEQGFPFEEEVRALPATGARIDPAGMSAGVQPGYEHVKVGDQDGRRSILVHVADVEPVRDLLPRLEGRELPATTGTVLEIVVGDRAAFDELHTRGACLACWPIWRDAELDDVSKHGVYFYEHSCDNWIAGPYARVTVPSAPVSVDRLPREIREQAVRFPARFAETVELQPAEIWPCDAWGPAWLASDRKTVHAFPDRDDDYAKEAGRLEDENPGELVIDPPRAVLRRETPHAKKPWWKLW